MRRRSECGSRKSEWGSWKSEVGGEKEEVLGWFLCEGGLGYSQAGTPVLRSALPGGGECGVGSAIHRREAKSVRHGSCFNNLTGWSGYRVEFPRANFHINSKHQVPSRKTNRRRGIHSASRACPSRFRMWQRASAVEILSWNLFGNCRLEILGRYPPREMAPLSLRAMSSSAFTMPNTFGGPRPSPRLRRAGSLCTFRGCRGGGVGASGVAREGSRGIGAGCKPALPIRPLCRG